MYFWCRVICFLKIIEAISVSKPEAHHSQNYDLVYPKINQKNPIIWPTYVGWNLSFGKRISRDKVKKVLSKFYHGTETPGIIGSIIP